MTIDQRHPQRWHLLWQQQQWGGGGVGVAAAPSLADAGEDYLPVTTSGIRRRRVRSLAMEAPRAMAGCTESADEVRQDDINTLFAGLSGPTVRVHAHPQ